MGREGPASLPQAYSTVAFLSSPARKLEPGNFTTKLAKLPSNQSTPLSKTLRDHLTTAPFHL